MPVFRVLFVLFVAALIGQAAEDPPTSIKVKVETLDGNSSAGELVALDSKEVAIKTATGEVKIPVDKVLTVTTDRAPKPIDKKAFWLVELNDGTELRCEAVAFKSKEALLKLLSGTEIKVETKNVRYALRDAHDKDILEKWQPIIRVKDRSYDVLVNRDNKGALNEIPGTIGDASEDGKTISFTLKDKDEALHVKIDGKQAFIFVRGPFVGARHLLCKVSDVDGNVIPVSQIERKENTYILSTLGDIKLNYQADAFIKLDFGKGKFTYLSDLEFTQKFSSTLSPNQEYAKLQWAVRKDKKMDGAGPIMIHGTIYRKGISVHATNEVIYDLGGNYEWFKTEVGFDDEISGVATPVIVEIFGDGKLLHTVKLKRRTSETEKLEDNKVSEKLEIIVKDVGLLRLKVRSGSLLGLEVSAYAEFGDARVTK